METKLKIIADDKIPFLKGILDPFIYIDYLPPSQITSNSIKDADALIIRTRTKCNAKLLDNSSVKFIATATIGFDHIDTAFCEAKGIKWINAPGCNSSSVQQYVAAALLTLGKQKKIDLTSQTIGIVGVGNVGSKVAKAAKIFGMNVLLNDPPRERIEGSKNFVSLDYLIEESDIISLHVPLNLIGADKTFHLADEKFFKKYKNPKVFLNTSRGEAADTSELKKALKNGTISSCALDVWENEPEIDYTLSNLSDISTPHIAGYSTEGKANGTAACVNALNEFFKLGMKKNWYPNELPIPNRSNIIKIDCEDKSKQEVLYECVASSYNILEDDWRLRNSMHNFEKQRSEYPTRREFNFYNVQLTNASESIKHSVSELGFNLNNY